MKKRWIFGLLVLMTACEKQADWDIAPQEGSPIAVSGGITDEVKSHAVKLSYLSTELNGVAIPLSDAEVSISDGSNIWTMTELGGEKGTYVTDSTVAGIPGHYYTLNIKTSTGNYQATDYMPVNTWFSPLRYSKGNSGQYQVTWVASSYHPTSAAMYEILIDWSHVAGYETVPAEECHAKLYFYTFTSIDVCELFKPEFEKVYFPVGAVITESRYSLSPAHEAFIRSMLIETSWNGGFFDLQSANLPGNLSTGAVGFFSASSVYTLTINVVH